MEGGNFDVQDESLIEGKFSNFQKQTRRTVRVY